MVRRLPLFVILLVGPILTAQAPSAPSNAEYPDFDRPLWALLNSGFRASVAAQSLAEEPESVATFTRLADAQRPDDAVRVLEHIVARLPEDLLVLGRALGGRMLGLDDEASGRRERLRSIVSAIKGKLPSLAREEAASLDYALIGIDSRLERTGSRERPSRLRRIVNLYPFTAAARLAEVDLLASILPISARVEALESFARSHPGTVEGAKALYLAASDIAHNLPEGQARKGEEPSARFARVVSMVRELESGAWPASEWTARAPSIVTGFFAYQARHSPDGIRRMVDLYREFVASHFVIEDNAAGWSATHVITTRLPDLLLAGGDASLEGMEPLFGEWADLTGQSDAVRFARALMFQRRTDESRSPDRAMWLQRARQAFAELAASGTGLYQRKALATLASLHFREGDFANAARAYQRYLDAYPGTDFAWAATLRLGQSHEQLGDWPAASAAYRSAATRFPENNPAGVLGFAHAARSEQALGNYADALRLYRLARQGWNPGYASGYEPGYQLNSPVRPEGGALKSGASITLRSLSAAIDRLEIATTVEGGGLLARGRWLIAYERWDEARVVLGRFLSRHPRSPHASAARYQANLAQLQHALDVGDVEKSTSDLNAALRELQAIKGTPWDPATGVARMAEAAILFRTGKAPEAQSVMRETLDQWRAHQTVPPGQNVLRDLLEEDVAEIRRIVFRPLGGPPYVFEKATRRSGWNAFDWPRQLPVFVVVDPDVPVVFADGTTRRLTLFRADPDTGTTLFIDDDAQRLMGKVLATIGGTRVRQPGHVMETPNQPIGMSREILTFWGTFFPTRPGHWGGWELETYPVVTQIVFYDTERTKAGAKVTIGYSGATVVLEKVNGSWKATGLTDFWMT